MKSDDNYVPALGYHWLTPLYDTVVRTTTREQVFKQALLAQAKLAAGQEALDLACGTGTLTVWAGQQAPGVRLHALDGDAQVLDRAKAKAHTAGVEIQWQHGRSTALPYAEGQFDRVLCSLFFHHLLPDAKQKSFSEIARVLKPGGELHVADWGKAANPLMRLAFYGIQWLDGFPNTADNVVGRLPDFMQSAGLAEAAETRRFSTMWGTLSLYRAVKPLKPAS